MRICFLASAESIHSHKWINYFNKLGYGVTWISIEKSPYKISSEIDYVEIVSNNKFAASLKAIKTLKRKLIENDIDLIHVHYLGFYGLISLFTNVRIISTAWGDDVLINGKNFFLKYLVLKMLKKSELITCDAYHMRDVLITWGVPKDKVHIINFGIDTNLFCKKPYNKKLNDKLGINERMSIVSTRNFDEIYDIPTLIRSIPIVIKELPDTVFVLLGKGPLKSSYLKLIDKLNVKDSVIFAGYVSNSELPELLSNMDIYVSTSLSDAGISAGTAEAMACETIAVISDSAENDKWINNKENGYLFSCGNHLQLSKILIKLLRNQDEFKDIAKKGREIIIQNNSYENEMNKMNEKYDLIINK